MLRRGPCSLHSLPRLHKSYSRWLKKAAHTVVHWTKGAVKTVGKFVKKEGPAVLHVLEKAGMGAVKGVGNALPALMTGNYVRIKVRPVCIPRSSLCTPLLHTPCDAHTRLHVYRRWQAHKSLSGQPAELSVETGFRSVGSNFPITHAHPNARDAIEQNLA
jgi:hypothetical protein